MHAFFGRLIDAITGTPVVVLVLWLGLATISVTLLLLTRTRWGQSRPLRKCAMLSLVAHLLLVGYATTIEIVASGPSRAEEPVVRVSLGETEVPQEEIEDAPAQKPWESFLSESDKPDTADPARVEPVETDKPAEENREPDDAIRPDVDRLMAETGGAALASPRPSAEPIDVPEPQPSDVPPSAIAEDVELPRQEPDVASAAETELEPRPTPTIPEGVASSVIREPRPMPEVTEMPTVEEPLPLPSGLSDALLAPARGKPAEPYLTPSPPQTLAPLPTFTAEPGLNASPLVSIPHEWIGASPLPMPVPRRALDDRELPDIYKLRIAPDRLEVAEPLGASPQSEEAVKAALRWLADNQEPDGSWSSQAHGGGREMMVAGRDRLGAGSRAETGMTGLALLAFLAAGHSHQTGDYRATVESGLRYLIVQQDRDGGLGGRATTYAYMYCHAMATFAMSEAYGMTGDPRLREPVRRAVARTLNAQNATSGGWRYYPGDPGDTSQLGWQLMALKSAELAGIPMPETARRGAIRFLESVAFGKSGGLAAYRPDERPSRSMTAEALACRQFLGIEPNPAANREAGDYLMGELPGVGEKNFYYWYYGTLAMFQLQGTHWERWNEALQDTLVRSQRKHGPLAGSWDTDSVWGGYGGRVYTTALATLSLEVYYRFLPLYVEVASSRPPPQR